MVISSAQGEPAIIISSFVAHILDVRAGVGDGGAIPAKELADLGHGHAQKHMAQIHGQLPRTGCVQAHARGGKEIAIANPCFTGHCANDNLAVAPLCLRQPIAFEPRCRGYPNRHRTTLS